MPQSSIDRRYDGQVVSERLISPEAYARYARAAVLESQGSYDEAATEYRAVLELDPQSAAAWTRLGATLCALGQPSTSTFEQAMRLAPEFAENSYARAVCLEQQDQLEQALRHSQSALALAPMEYRHTELAARLLEKLGRTAAARRLLVAGRLQFPGARAAQRALAAFADRYDDEALLRLAFCLTSDSPTDTGEECNFVERRASFDTRPRAASVRKRSTDPMVERALCAAARGDSKTAIGIAATILDADQDNGDAWVALVYASDVDQDSVNFADAVSRLGENPTLVFELSRRLFTELLERRAGVAAARAWQSANSEALAPLLQSERACYGTQQR